MNYLLDSHTHHLINGKCQMTAEQCRGLIHQALVQIGVPFQGLINQTPTAVFSSRTAWQDLTPLWGRDGRVERIFFTNFFLMGIMMMALNRSWSIGGSDKDGKYGFFI